MGTYRRSAMTMLTWAQELSRCLARTQRLALTSKRYLWILPAVVLILLSLALRTGTQRKADPHIRYVPVTRKIASGRVLVKPRERVEYRIEITPAMYNAQVIGSFTAYGGSTNTVTAALMPETEYASWIAGHDAKAYYSSDGQKNVDQFAVRLDPGMYSFVISNRLSRTATKYVYLDVELIYDKAETY